MPTCHYCGPSDRELRPYGPDGATVCLPCLKADPERERAAREVYVGLLQAAAAASPDNVALIGHPDGPQPGHPDGTVIR
jgi:hypothetical protein